MCKVVKSPGDGHCLLHSVTNAYNAVTATASACIDIDVLSKKLKDETIMNAERYIDFIEGNGLPSLISGLNDYIYNTRYDYSCGDLVPVILTNALAIKLLIVTRNMNMYDVLLIESECTVGDHKGTVMVLKSGQHYDSIVDRACCNNCIPTAIDDVPSQNINTYSSLK